MEKSIKKLRDDYKSFMNGEKSNLSVKTNALILLDIAQSKGNNNVVDEITDMLMDLELSIAENKCNCHKGDSCY
ncbi:hypothetical protein MUO66_03820 [Candidatus Bathyarchaeota archaeon]|nr:hypothetical protein [Candidatus Bathyarchaeota archaeon]